MRHAYVRYAVDVSLWNERGLTKYAPHILPVRPDVMPGRIGQQGSVFTFHMHGAADVRNSTMLTLAIDARSKPRIRAELHRLNINLFTIYYDLDNLSKQIMSSWGFA